MVRIELLPGRFPGESGRASREGERSVIGTELGETSISGQAGMGVFCPSGKGGVG